MRQLRAEGRVAVHHEGIAVEDQLVLAADQVDVDRRHPLRDDMLAHRVQAHVLLAHVKWRAVQHQQHLSAGGARACRRLRVPGILADIDAEAHALDLEHEWRIGRRKIAPLVEHIGVRQLILAIGAENLAVDQHRGRIASHALLRQRMADHHVQVGQRCQIGCQGLQLFRAFCVECLTQQQVFRRIARQRQFRRQYDVGALLRRPAREFDDLFPVAGEIPDGAVDLRNGDFYGHGIDVMNGWMAGDAHGRQPAQSLLNRKGIRPE